MRRHTRAIIYAFMEHDNINLIARLLKTKFGGDPVVGKFLGDHLFSQMDSFSHEMEQEMLMSDVLPGVTMNDQLICFNKQFLARIDIFIRENVLGLVEEENPVYTVHDGLSTSRYGEKHYQGKANDILKSWENNSGRVAQARDDNAGDIYPNNPYYMNSSVGDIVGHHTGQLGKGVCSKPTIERMDNRVENMDNNYYNDDNYKKLTAQLTESFNSGPTGRSTPLLFTTGPSLPPHGNFAPITPLMAQAPSRENNYHSRCNGSINTSTGITFSDQSSYGTSNHIGFYEKTSAKQSLNAMTLPHEMYIFGDATPASDARLMERRIFRGNYDTSTKYNPYASNGNGINTGTGVENGIPTYEVRLQRRALDRDVSEGLRNAEKDCINYRQNMSGLINRIDRKQAEMAKYSIMYPDCEAKYTDARRNLRLHGNMENVNDDKRYC